MDESIFAHEINEFHGIVEAVAAATQMRACSRVGTSHLLVYHLNDALSIMLHTGRLGEPLLQLLWSSASSPVRGSD